LRERNGKTADRTFRFGYHIFRNCHWDVLSMPQPQSNVKVFYYASPTEADDEQRKGLQQCQGVDGEETG
jgi:hypothetical protein